VVISPRRPSHFKLHALTPHHHAPPNPRAPATAQASLRPHRRLCLVVLVICLGGRRSEATDDEEQSSDCRAARHPTLPTQARRSKAAQALPQQARDGRARSHASYPIPYTIIQTTPSQKRASMARPKAGSGSSSSASSSPRGDHGLTTMQKLVLLKDNVLKKVDHQMEKHPALTFRPQLLQLEKKVNVPAPALFIIGSSLTVLILVLILSMEGVA
jgi:hypothetical protein